MNIEVIQDPGTGLAAYARIPVAFEVSEVFDVAAGPDGGEFRLSARRLTIPCIKDYDAAGGERPTQWARIASMSQSGDSLPPASTASASAEQRLLAPRRA
jgi:hypothetical protein